MSDRDAFLKMFDNEEIQDRHFDVYTGFNKNDPAYKHRNVYSVYLDNFDIEFIFDESGNLIDIVKFAI